MTTLVTGERHRFVAVEADRRIAWTACVLRLARVGQKFDPKSVYQRANFPKHEHPHPCPRCEE